MGFTHKEVLEEAYSELQFDKEDLELFKPFTDLPADAQLQNLVAILQLCIYISNNAHTEFPNQIPLALLGKFKTRFGASWKINVEIAIGKMKKFMETPMV